MDVLEVIKIVGAGVLAILGSEGVKIILKGRNDIENKKLEIEADKNMADHEQIRELQTENAKLRVELESAKSRIAELEVAMVKVDTFINTIAAVIPDEVLQKAIERLRSGS